MYHVKQKKKNKKQITSNFRCKTNNNKKINVHIDGLSHELIKSYFIL